MTAMSIFELPSYRALTKSLNLHLGGSKGDFDIDFVLFQCVGTAQFDHYQAQLLNAWSRPRFNHLESCDNGHRTAVVQLERPKRIKAGSIKYVMLRDPEQGAPRAGFYVAQVYSEVEDRPGMLSAILANNGQRCSKRLDGMIDIQVGDGNLVRCGEASLIQQLR